MVTVTSKEELEKALRNKEEEILVEGEMAKKIAKKAKIKKGGLIVGGLSILTGVVLLPFTGGGSVFAIAQGLTAGGVAISTTEIFVGAGILLSASSLLLLNKYEIIIDISKSSDSKRVILKFKPNKK